MARDAQFHKQASLFDNELDPVNEARHHAVRLLVNREHSYYELHQKLIQKGHDSDSVVTALDDLVARGKLSDERFTEMFITSRVNRGTGPNKIMAELLQKDVSDIIIFQALRGCGVNWIQFAEQARQKKFGNSIPDNYDEKMRQARFLQNRGYSAEHMPNLFN
ncbi:Regulatory protein RecX [hydrothermal vent metagenome]|uniref:Regulatory protein RecX n=1 Tax=hydrothermal vent metagenome TaxID=652676 RepID=A0A3B1AND6_9ZZZZ